MQCFQLPEFQTLSKLQVYTMETEEFDSWFGIVHYLIQVLFNISYLPFRRNKKDTVLNLISILLVHNFDPNIWNSHLGTTPSPQQQAGIVVTTHDFTSTGQCADLKRAQL